MKSLTYHITLDNNDFWEYAERHRFGKEDMPTLSQDSVFFNELWEIKNMWRVYPMMPTKRKLQKNLMNLLRE